MPDEPVLTLKCISKSFGRRKVLNSLDGSIERGKVVGLLGENGAGKTTLFRIILDAILPDEGQVRIMGEQPDGSGSARQKIGYIPERPAFHSFMTAGEVLEFRSKIYTNWDRNRAQQYLRQLRLDPSTTIRDASKGTLARLAWICATAHRPPLLLLDEPTSGLDLLVRESVLNEMVRELTEHGQTIFVANHRMEEMINLLDEIWLLSNGSITKKVAVEELRSSSRRVTGRLKKEAPPHLNILEEHRMGSAVSWVTTDPQTLLAIQDLALLEQMEVFAVPPEICLRALLKQQETK